MSILVHLPPLAHEDATDTRSNSTLHVSPELSRTTTHSSWVGVNEPISIQQKKCGDIPVGLREKIHFSIALHDLQSSQLWFDIFSSQESLLSRIKLVGSLRTYFGRSYLAPVKAIQTFQYKM